ncbi:MAG: DUF2284 domain-containing protein [Clostridia bacterium]|nr:DUF2284 domain-containing protein [Clostridia bacterium]
MCEKEKIFAELLSLTSEIGVFKVKIIQTEKVETDKSFRLLCESNACGMYGKCYMCPPNVGNIDELMAQIKNYDYGLVYQTVGQIEDSYDFEGMLEEKKKSYLITQKLRKVFENLGILKVLHLGAGGCGVCDKCAQQDGLPCHFPELATPSLEAYGVNVSNLAKVVDMKYTNGQNTVTYFGMVLFSLGEK